MVAIRRVFVFLCLLVIGGLVWAGIYARKQGFTHTWRELVEEELARQGYHVDIGKLTLGAFRGLVAEDVRFYRDPARRELFAEVDDVYLDLGLEQIFEKRISVDSLDIQDATLSLPLEGDTPEKPSRLEIRDISGRVALTESLIEVVRMEANLGGVDVRVRGSLFRAPNRTSQEVSPGVEVVEMALSRMPMLKRWIDFVETFDFSGENPQLQIEFQGDLRDLSMTSGTAMFSAATFRKRGTSYPVLGLEVDAEYNGEIDQLKISRFEVRDRSGILQATGKWSRTSGRLQFQVDSSADVVNLASLFVTNQRWGEIVFFQPPALNLDGEVQVEAFIERVRDFDLGRDEGPFDFPGQLVGEFQAERFVTSGVVFTGGRGDFSLKGRSFYVRNLRVDHKSGVAFLNLMREPGRGERSVRFQSEIKMDPRVFAPFVREEDTKRFLRNWSFSDNSGIYLAAAGRCADLGMRDLEASGVIDLRDFRLNGVPFLELETDFEAEGNIRRYKNLRMTREEGQIKADLAVVDTATRQWRVEGAESRVDLLEGMGAFSPVVRDWLRPYRFSAPPLLQLDGAIDARPADEDGPRERATDLSIGFSCEGSVYVDVLGKEIPLSFPSGEVGIHGDRAELHSLEARVFGGRLALDLKTDAFLSDSPGYEAALEFEDVDLVSLARLYEVSGDIGGRLVGEVLLTGSGQGIESIDGRGQIAMQGSDPLQLPLFGDLRETIGDTGAAGADPPGMTAPFVITGGVLDCRKVRLQSPGSVLEGWLTLDGAEGKITSELAGADGRLFRGEGHWRTPLWVPIDASGGTLSANRREIPLAR